MRTLLLREILVVEEGRGRGEIHSAPMGIGARQSGTIEIWQCSGISGREKSVAQSLDQVDRSGCASRPAASGSRPRRQGGGQAGFGACDEGGAKVVGGHPRGSRWMDGPPPAA